MCVHRLGVLKCPKLEKRVCLCWWSQILEKRWWNTKKKKETCKNTFRVFVWRWIHFHKPKHIRVVFRTRRCMCVHRLGVLKCLKLEKGVCLCWWSQILEKRWWNTKKKKEKKHAKTHLGSFFMHGKYVFWKSILKYKCPHSGVKISKNCKGSFGPLLSSFWGPSESFKGPDFHFLLKGLITVLLPP